MRKFFLLATMSLALCTIPVACGDEDDEIIPNPNPGGSTTSPSVSDFGGERLMAITDDYGEHSSFLYNSDGTLYQVSDDDDGTIVFNYQKGTLTWIYEDEDYSETQVASFKTNKQGYITELKIDEPCDDGYIKGGYTFSYNNAGLLTSVQYNSTYKDGSSSEVYNSSWQFTWDGDVLSKVDAKSIGTFSDEYENWIENYSHSTYCTYTGAPNNAYMQYSVGLINGIDLDSSLESLMLVGVLGKASSKLPTQITYYYTDEDGEDQQISKFNYVLNSKGLIESETETINKWGSCKYEYIYSSDATKSYLPSFKSKARSEHEKFSRKHHKGLFGKVK